MTKALRLNKETLQILQGAEGTAGAGLAVVDPGATRGTVCFIITQTCASICITNCFTQCGFCNITAGGTCISGGPVCVKLTG